ncbi:unnamed protein product, partial [Larinioides sclopetarius]
MVLSRTCSIPLQFVCYVNSSWKVSGSLVSMLNKRCRLKDQHMSGRGFTS